MDKFRQNVNDKRNLKLESYDDLYNWSVSSYSLFWADVVDFCKIKLSQTYTEVVDVMKGIDEIPKWFIGAKLNYAENLLWRRDNATALYITGEGRPNPIKVTFVELHERVARYAAAMRKMGIQSGDCVVGYLTNGEVAVEAYLATASIGALWSSTSPDFGVTAVLDRFCQIKPKLMFSIDAVTYNGKTHSHLEKLRQVVVGLPELVKVVITTDMDDDVASKIMDIPRSSSLEQFLRDGTDDDRVPELQFTQVSFDHPLAILYSSGTTGTPKGMVHSVGGTLLQHVKEHYIHGDMNGNDVVFYYTTIGWMMWNWLVSALALGCTIVLYEGSPFQPNKTSIWDLVDKIGINVLGTSAKGLSVCEQMGIKPRETHKLTSLHTILSSGSPLKPQSFDYIYRDVKSNLLLGSITGGSDIISLFAGHNMQLPVYRGEIQCRCLGMAVECFDESGNSVYDKKGELVCTKPFPCMPTHFWNDDNGVKYRKAYFSHFPGVWSHGDYCVINSRTKGIVMLGRSDSTLNPNGVRFGSAEIYNVVERFSEVADSICVSQDLSDSEERVVLFLKLQNDQVDFTPLVAAIKTAIRNQLSARHVPAVFERVSDIPYTISGKKVEIAVKKIINGEIVTERGALANPESLDLYFNLPCLARG